MNKRKISGNASKENQDPSKIKNKKLRFQSIQNENKSSSILLETTYCQKTNQLNNKPFNNLNGQLGKENFHQEKSDFLMTILKKSEILNKQQVLNGKLTNTPSLALNFFDVLQTGCLTDKDLSTLRDFILTTFSQDNLKQFLDEIMSEYRKIKSSLFVKSLFEFRIKYLEESISNGPQFTWHMACPKFKDTGVNLRKETSDSKERELISSFFKSSRENIYFESRPAYIRIFAQNYSGLQEGYSCEVRQIGTGRKTCIEIVKTKEYYQSLMVAHEKKCLETNKQLRILKEFLGK
jgi:hypothetical protein